MDFHLAFTPKPFDTTISHRDKLLLTGSCFTEQIGSKLAAHKFSVLDNPHGILFNPVSIARAVSSYIDHQQYKKEDLFYQNESWNSWEHHSRFSHPDADECLRLINESQSRAHAFLKDAGWLLITLGSAFVYELENKSVVANCHKVPTDKFNKRLLAVDEVTRALQTMISKTVAFNPGIRIIFTISPVRHLRDGFVENNRSKATLIQAVHQLVEMNSNCFYFPAYELVIDDLRDYRFYAEDMVHPNYAATNYVWEKFIAACIDEPSQQLMKEIAVITAARNHKPFNPTSQQHKKFLQANLEKLRKLQEQYPYINFEEEAAFFTSW
ncbi:MAG TPA: GSCFA domain-containing protein [Ferruginibacter sp.]|nr:GSCFA domain-containing protein [Chitinophagaceae bacterium]HRI26177.1 GSCFA domain-containing protein [Ferruginibacter sp.]